jgi:hypothetical protein
MISVFVWSELIFMALIFLNWYCALHLKNHRYFFFGLLMTGFLACLQRNAGLFWICGVCCWLLFDSSLSLKLRIRDSVILFLVSSSGMWAWNIYNTFFIPADFSFYSHNFFADIFPNLKSILGAIGKMIVPINGTVAIAIGLLFLLVAVIQFVFKENADRNIQFPMVVMGFYSGGFLTMPYLDIFEMDRYFSVVTPIVYLLILLLIQERTQSEKRSSKIIIYVLVFAWLSYPLTRTFRNVQAWHERSCSDPIK